MATPIDVKDMELGFIENADSWKLSPHYFPSKAGGRPSWLSLGDVPDMKDISCKSCNKQCVFLLQVYCPLDANDNCFHRTLFLFMCQNRTCHSHNSRLPFSVFRSQLPRRNDYYEFEPIDADLEVSFSPILEKHGINLCRVCGCNAGSKKCAKCSKIYYCSREHQLLHWKNGHKESCCKEDNLPVSFKLLFPEYEIVTETEPPCVQPADGDDRALTTPLHDVEADGSGNAYSTAELEEMAMKATKEDKIFLNFKERISVEPEQVLRYQRGGVPLWVSRQHQPMVTDIPPCPCGSKRIFEFQVMPQLLLHMKVDSLDDGGIDWGTLAIYTCEASCSEGKDYHEEFLWKQDYEKTADTAKS